MYENHSNGRKTFYCTVVALWLSTFINLWAVYSAFTSTKIINQARFYALDLKYTVDDHNVQPANYSHLSCRIFPPIAVMRPVGPLCMTSA